jgi:NADH:ubiquinone oxidoreductase subunit F (NADH-binding)
MKIIKPQFLAVISLIVIIAGIGTGYGGYRLQTKDAAGSNGSNAGGALQQVAKGKVNNGDVFGVPDEKTFKDMAEGYLEAGGIDGEGSHKLIRPGGVSQTVYLTSSVTDLNDFVGMDVKVWGETNKGQKAGWLMDVGRIEVVKTTGTAPAGE